MRVPRWRTLGPESGALSPSDEIHRCLAVCSSRVELLKMGQPGDAVIVSGLMRLILEELGTAGPAWRESPRSVAERQSAQVDRVEASDSVDRGISCVRRGSRE